MTLFDIHVWLFHLPLTVIIIIITYLFFNLSFFHWAIFLLSMTWYLHFFYYLTLEYNFWYSDCFLSFLFVNICFPSQKGLPKLPNEMNIISQIKILCSSLFYLDPRYIDIYIPGDCIFLFKCVNVQIKKTHKHTHTKQEPVHKPQF